MKYILKKTRCICILFVFSTFWLLNTANANITKQTDASIQYTFSYERDSSDFSSNLLPIENTSYLVDDSPATSLGDSIESQFYQVGIDKIQTPIFNSTETNNTFIDSFDYNDSTSVIQTDDFIIPEYEMAVWKLSGNIETERCQLNVSGLTMSLGEYSNNIENLNGDDTLDIDFTPERGGDYRSVENVNGIGSIKWSGTAERTIDEDCFPYATTTLSDDSDNTGAGYEYSTGATQDSYYEYVMYFPNVLDVATRLTIRRYIYLYAGSPADNHPWFKVFLRDNTLTAITGKISWDLVFSWANFWKTGYGPKSYFTGDIEIYPEIDNIAGGGVGIQGGLAVLIQSGCRVSNFEYEAPQKIRDLTTFAQVEQTDECIEGIIDFDSGPSNLLSNVNIEIDIDTNCEGTINYYTKSGTWASAFDINADSGILNVNDLPMNRNEPKLKILLYKREGASLTIQYLNLSAFIVPVSIQINLTHDSGGEGTEFETLNMALVKANRIESTNNLTVEYLISSDEFEHWDGTTTPLYVPAQQINVTFTNLYLPICQIEWNVNYSVNSYVTPSEINASINSEAISDTGLNSGIVEFGDFQNILEFTANSESYSKININATLTLTRDLTQITKTLFRDNWNLQGASNLTITKIEIINVNNILHVYLGGIDVGSDIVLYPDYSIQKNGPCYVSIVLGEPAYRKLLFINNIQDSATITTTMAVTFPVYEFENISPGDLEVNLFSDGFTSNNTRFLFDENRNITHYQENFTDELWDNATKNSNLDSTLVNESYANLTCLNQTHFYELNIQENFTYTNLTRNESSGQLFIQNNELNSMDGALLEYQDSRDITDMLLMSGTGNHDSGDYAYHSTVSLYTECAAVQEYYLTSYTSGTVEFWVYRNLFTLSTNRIGIFFGSDAVNLWYFSITSDYLQWFNGVESEVVHIFEPAVWYHVRFTYNFATQLCDAFVNETLIFDDKSPIGTPTGPVALLAFEVNNLGTQVLAVDAFGYNEDPGYSTGDNLIFTLIPDSSLYTLSGSEYVNVVNQTRETFESSYSNYVELTSDDTVIENFESYDIGEDPSVENPTVWSTQEEPTFEVAMYGDKVADVIGTGDSHVIYTFVENSPSGTYGIWINLKILIRQTGDTYPTSVSLFAGGTQFLVLLFCDDMYIYTQNPSYEFVNTGVQYSGGLSAQDYNITIDSSSTISIDGPMGAMVSGLPMSTTTFTTSVTKIEIGTASVEESTRLTIASIESSWYNDETDGNFIKCTNEFGFTGIGSHSLRYHQTDLTGSNPVVTYTLPVITPNSFTIHVYLRDDSDDYTLFCVGIDSIINLTFIDDSGISLILNDALWTGITWDYETWYEISFIFDWNSSKYHVNFAGIPSDDFDIDFVAINTTIFSRGPESGDSGKQQTTFIDDFSLEFNNINYTFSFSEQSTFNISFSIDMLTNQPLYFILNETEHVITESGDYSYLINGYAFVITFYSLMNIINFTSLNFTYVVDYAYLNVSTLFDISDLTECQSLYINFTSQIYSGIGSFALDSGNVHLMFDIDANQTYSYNLTYQIINSGSTISELDLDAIRFSFQIETNNTNLIIDDILIWDESDEIYINGTRLATDGYYTVDTSFNITNLDIIRRSGNEFNISVYTNATLVFDAETWHYSYTFEPVPLTYSNMTINSLFIEHGYEGGTQLFINYQRVESNDAAFLLLSGYNDTIIAGETIDILITIETLNNPIFFQESESVTTNNTGVIYNTTLFSNSTYQYHYVDFSESLSIVNASVTYQGTEISLARKTGTNTFYFTYDATIYDVFIIHVVINPQFSTSVYQEFNNGTNANFTTVIDSDIAITNLRCQVDLSSFEVFMQNWSINGIDSIVSQAENRILMFTLPEIDAGTNTYTLNGRATIPIAQIANYVIQPYTILSQDVEILYYGYLSYPVYSKGFQVNTSQFGAEYTLDGVHYMNTSLDIDEIGMFSCSSGWGTGITSSYVRFTARPVTGISQTRNGTTVTLVINSSLPVLEGWYVLNIDDVGNRRVSFDITEYSTATYNSTACIVQGMVLEHGTNEFTFTIRIIDAIENMLFALPIIVVILIAIVIYYTRKRKITWDSIKSSVKNWFTRVKKR